MTDATESTAPAIRRFRVTGSDPGQAAAVYSDAFDGGRFVARPVRDDFVFRYAYFGNDRITLRSSETTGAIAGEVPFLRDYVVSWFRSGSGSLTSNCFTRRGAELTPFLLPAERSFTLALEPHRQNLVHFAPAFLEDVATESHSGPRQAISFDHESDPDPRTLTRWREAVSEATTAIVEPTTAPLVRSDAELTLARTMLALFAWRAWDVPAPLRTPPTWRVRAALDYMQHHAAEPITPADAARAAGLHTRTFQQATQKHLGQSPTAYLREVRLDRVHRDLVAAEPGSVTVAEAAERWGFGNLGRFAASYRLRFDEKPSATLRR